MRITINSNSWYCTKCKLSEYILIAAMVGFSPGNNLKVTCMITFSELENKYLDYFSDQDTIHFAFICSKGSAGSMF